MSLTISSPATHRELTILPTVKQELGSTSDADDAYLTDLIQQATSYLETQTGRQFARERIVEKRATNGEQRIVLERYPIVQIHSISKGGSTISSTSYEIEDKDAGFLFREIGWDATTIWSENITLHPTRFGRHDWQIDYTAGYVLPGSSLPDSTGSTASTAPIRDLPHDLERACIDLVKSWLYRRTDNPNIRSQRTGDASETYFDTGGLGGVAGVPPSVASVIDRYRRIE